jgi:serine/threonine protein kinase
MQVCDFGISRILQSDYLPSTLAMGTVQYTSPEVIRGGKVSEKSDIFSFGVVLWELVTLEIPWKGLRAEQVIFAVGAEGKLLPLDNVMQLDVKSLIEACWHPQPRERPSFAAIIEALSAMSVRGLTSLKE